MFYIGINFNISPYGKKKNKENTRKKKSSGECFDLREKESNFRVDKINE